MILFIILTKPQAVKMLIDEVKERKNKSLWWINKRSVLKKKLDTAVLDPLQFWISAGVVSTPAGKACRKVAGWRPRGDSGETDTDTCLNAHMSKHSHAAQIVLSEAH